MNDQIKKKLEAERERMNKKFGHLSADLGSTSYKLNVIPTGILSLDFALGTGGWPLGHPVEVYGPPDTGKSSIVGLNAIRSAQELGLGCGIVALEPGFDETWAAKHGVDPDGVLVGRPDNGEDAFAMLYDWILGDAIDFILFDSIGAILKGSETDPKTGKPVQAGQSGLITWGVKRCLMPLWKRNKSVIFLNQVRDDMNSRITGIVDSPGGWALKHSSAVRVHIRPGRERFTVTDKDGKDSYDMVIGQQIVATIKRNKMDEGTGKRASFDFYSKEVEGYPFGVDKVADTLATALRAGVVKQAGAYYRHPSFPESSNGENQVQGRGAFADLLQENPKIYEIIRHEVLTVMFAKQQKEDQDAVLS